MQALFFRRAFPYPDTLPAFTLAQIFEAVPEFLFETFLRMQLIAISQRHEKIEIFLQVCLSRHTDTPGYEIVPLTPQVQFRKELRVLVILAVWQQSLYDLPFPFAFIGKNILGRLLTVL